MACRRCSRIRRDAITWTSRPGSSATCCTTYSPLGRTKRRPRNLRPTHHRSSSRGTTGSLSPGTRPSWPSPSGSRSTSGRPRFSGSPVLLAAGLHIYMRNQKPELSFASSGEGFPWARGSLRCGRAWELSAPAAPRQGRDGRPGGAGSGRTRAPAGPGDRCRESRGRCAGGPSGSTGLRAGSPSALLGAPAGSDPGTGAAKTAHPRLRHRHRPSPARRPLLPGSPT